MQGTVKFFQKSRGWGYVKADDGKEYFVHYSQIQMDGFKTLNTGDIVSFEVSKPDEGDRIHAVNVQPVLTLAMVIRELKKDKLHIIRNEENKNLHGWYVVDKSNRPVVDKEMNLIELAEYVGFKVVEASA